MARLRPQGARVGVFACVAILVTVADAKVARAQLERIIQARLIFRGCRADRGESLSFASGV